MSHCESARGAVEVYGARVGFHGAQTRPVCYGG